MREKERATKPHTTKQEARRKHQGTTAPYENKKHTRDKKETRPRKQEKRRRGKGGEITPCR
jgi:hypothetical protein